MNRLLKRKDFLAAAAAARANSGSLLLQARERRDDAPPRIGLTVTKKHGNAVERNRIRRRLRAAVRDAVPRAAKDGFDYVIVARRIAISARYDELVREIERAMNRVHTARPASGGSRVAKAGRAEPPRADGDPAHDH